MITLAHLIQRATINWASTASIAEVIGAEMSTRTETRPMDLPLTTMMDGVQAYGTLNAPRLTHTYSRP